MTPQRPSAFAHIDHRNSLLPVVPERVAFNATRFAWGLLTGGALVAIWEYLL
jgi:hypothetical protein